MISILSLFISKIELKWYCARNFLEAIATLLVIGNTCQFVFENMRISLQVFAKILQMRQDCSIYKQFLRIEILPGKTHKQKRERENPERNT